LRGERGAEVGVEEDAEERAASGQAGTVGEFGIVGEDGADASEDGVAGVTEALDFGASSGTREPMWLIGVAGGWWGSELTIDRERGLQGDEGGSGLDEVSEGFVEAAGRLLEGTESDFDVGGAELCDALPADERVGVFGGDDDADDSGGDQRVGAGAGAAMVGAGFEGDVGGGTSGREASRGCHFERDDLGMVAVVVEMRAFADDAVLIVDEDAAYLRVGGGKGGRLSRELESSLHEDFVLRRGQHAFEDSWKRCYRADESRFLLCWHLLWKMLRTPGAHTARHVQDSFEVMCCEQTGRDARTIAAATDCRDGDIARQVRETVR